MELCSLTNHADSLSSQQGWYHRSATAASESTTFITLGRRSQQGPPRIATEKSHLYWPYLIERTVSQEKRRRGEWCCAVVAHCSRCHLFDLRQCQLLGVLPSTVVHITFNESHHSTRVRTLSPFVGLSRMRPLRIRQFDDTVTTTLVPS